VIGQSVQRLEDEPLLTGRGKFVANLSFPDELHMRVVRSPYAHATLLNVDVQPAIALPRVVAAWTFADVAHIPPIEFRPTKVQGLEPYCQTILAKDRLRYVGEPVAVVFAENSYVAEDAAERLACACGQRFVPGVHGRAAPGGVARKAHNNRWKWCTPCSRVGE